MTQMDHLIEKHATYANFLFGCAVSGLVVFVAAFAWFLYQRRSKRIQRREERRQQRSRGGRGKR